QSHWRCACGSGMFLNRIKKASCQRLSRRPTLVLVEIVWGPDQLNHNFRVNLIKILPSKL
ncbi:hypothetical protein NDU88_000911, partial [Pleurodeles waltl]